MRTWKVGSFTAAFILIIIGILMLVGNFTKINLFNILMTVWPLAIIMIGIEIIIFLTYTKENQKFVMSGLSIFLIIIIFISSLFYSAIFPLKGFYIKNENELLSAMNIYKASAEIKKTIIIDMKDRKNINLINELGYTENVKSSDGNVKLDIYVKVRYNGKEPDIEAIAEKIIMVGEASEPEVRIINDHPNDVDIDVLVKAWVPENVSVNGLS